MNVNFHSVCAYVKCLSEPDFMVNSLFIHIVSQNCIVISLRFLIISMKTTEKALQMRAATKRYGLTYTSFYVRNSFKALIWHVPF